MKQYSTEGYRLPELRDQRFAPEHDRSGQLRPRRLRCQQTPTRAAL